MRLQKEGEYEQVGVERCSTKNEERAARHVEAERRGNWGKVTEIDPREREMCEQKRCERQEFLACKRQTAEARKRNNCDLASDTKHWLWLLKNREMRGFECPLILTCKMF